VKAEGEGFFAVCRFDQYTHADFERTFLANGREKIG
jgi:hypothetical protein